MLVDLETAAGDDFGELVEADLASLLDEVTTLFFTFFGGSFLVVSDE